MNPFASRSSKCTPEMVVKIRQRYAAGETQSSLCREYNLSISQIGRIIRGEAWKRFTGGAPVMTSQQVDIDMTLNHLSNQGMPMASKETIEASQAKVLRILAATGTPMDISDPSSVPTLNSDPTPPPIDYAHLPAVTVAKTKDNDNHADNTEDLSREQTKE